MATCRRNKWLQHSLAVSGTKLYGHLLKYAFLLANINIAIELDRKVPACVVALTRDLHMASLTFYVKVRNWVFGI